MSFLRLEPQCIDAALFREEKAGDIPEQGGFACAVPSQQAINMVWLKVEVQIRRINAKLRGWSDYFRIGTTSKAYRNIDTHVRQRVRQWLRAKFKGSRSPVQLWRNCGQ